MGIEVPKHFENIISAINHSVASSWFFLVYAYTTMHGQTHIKSTSLFVIKGYGFLATACHITCNYTVNMSLLYHCCRMYTVKLLLISPHRHQETPYCSVAVRKLSCEHWICFPHTFLGQMARYNFLSATWA